MGSRHMKSVSLTTPQNTEIDIVNYISPMFNPKHLYEFTCETAPFTEALEECP